MLKYDFSKRTVSQSVPIAAAITAYARMYMNELMHLENYKYYYTDTDSLVTDKPLPSKYIGNELGQLKLEYSNFKGLYVSPKLYLIELNDRKTIVKARTIGSDLSINDMNILYKGHSITKFKTKWFKNIYKGNIQVRSTNINLASNLEKRNKVIINGEWVTTSPLIIHK